MKITSIMQKYAPLVTWVKFRNEPEVILPSEEQRPQWYNIRQILPSYVWTGPGVLTLDDFGAKVEARLVCVPVLEHSERRGQLDRLRTWYHAVMATPVNTRSKERVLVSPILDQLRPQLADYDSATDMLAALMEVLKYWHLNEDNVSVIVYLHVGPFHRRVMWGLGDEPSLLKDRIFTNGCRLSVRTDADVRRLWREVQAKHSSDFAVVIPFDLEKFEAQFLAGDPDARAIHSVEETYLPFTSTFTMDVRCHQLDDEYAPPTEYVYPRMLSDPFEENKWMNQRDDPADWSANYKRYHIGEEPPHPADVDSDPEDEPKDFVLWIYPEKLFANFKAMHDIIVDESLTVKHISTVCQTFVDGAEDVATACEGRILVDERMEFHVTKAPMTTGVNVRLVCVPAMDETLAAKSVTAYHTHWYRPLLALINHTDATHAFITPIKNSANRDTNEHAAMALHEVLFALGFATERHIRLVVFFPEYKDTQNSNAPYAAPHDFELYLGERYGNIRVKVRYGNVLRYALFQQTRPNKRIALVFPVNRAAYTQRRFLQPASYSVHGDVLAMGTSMFTLQASSPCTRTTINDALHTTMMKMLKQIHRFKEQMKKVSILDSIEIERLKSRYQSGSMACYYHDKKPEYYPMEIDEDYIIQTNMPRHVYVGDGELLDFPGKPLELVCVAVVPAVFDPLRPRIQTTAQDYRRMWFHALCCAPYKVTTAQQKKMVVATPFLGYNEPHHESPRMSVNALVYVLGKWNRWCENRDVYLELFIHCGIFQRNVWTFLKNNMGWRKNHIVGRCTMRIITSNSVTKFWGNVMNKHNPLTQHVRIIVPVELQSFGTGEIVHSDDPQILSVGQMYNVFTSAFLMNSSVLPSDWFKDNLLKKSYPVELWDENPEID